VIEAAVEAVLKAIRPGLEAEGGTIELVAVERGIACVRVRLSGVNPPGAVPGLLIGIQRSVQSEVPEVRAVVNQDLIEAGYALEHLARQMERLRLDHGRRTTDHRHMPTEDQ
jgi:Fe-S cluster biogenesis protein NfuA